MKKNIISLLILIVSGVNSVPVFAQPVYYSSYFKQPDLLIDYVNDCAQFWITARDDTYGGFYKDVGRSGSILSSSYKSLVSNSRNAYGFARAFMLTGNEEYLDFSQSALGFMYNHNWDKSYGGWFNETSRSGANPYTGDKTAFDQHYALLGIMAYYEATGDTIAFNKLDSSYVYMDTTFWDNSDLQYGYYDNVSRNGNTKSGKSFNATVDAITTHVYNLYLLTGEQKYMDRLMDLKSNINDYLVPSMESSAIGFAELYNTDWSINTSQNRTIMGHVLKTGWCLGRTHRISADIAALDNAKLLIQDVLDNGYDHEYGGPFKDYDRISGEMMMYGAYDEAKAWWQVEQAITSGLMLFEITWDQKYLEMADESLDFFMKYFVDPEYGEVYADRSKTGGRVAYSGGYWDENKGSSWKAGYHSIETGYYSYLYGKLLLKQEPVSLYYKYEPVNYERVVRMNPLAVDFDKLSIESIKLNNEQYTNFDADARLLTIPAGISGKFEVTYFMAGLNDVVASASDVDEPNIIVEIYPNPFVSSTRIVFELASENNVELTVLNSSGSMVTELMNQKMSPGIKQIDWDASKFPEGIYIILLKTGNTMVTKKVVKIN